MKSAIQRQQLYSMRKEGANFFCIAEDACLRWKQDNRACRMASTDKSYWPAYMDDALTSEQAERLYKDVEEGVAATHTCYLKTSLCLRMCR